MFKPESEKNKRLAGIPRRTFVLTSVTATAGIILWGAGKAGMLNATSELTTQEVTVVLFSDSGERIRKVRIPKVVKTEEEWQKQLSRSPSHINRHEDTELAFTGKFWNLHE